MVVELILDSRLSETVGLRSEKSRHTYGAEARSAAFALSARSPRPGRLARLSHRALTRCKSARGLPCRGSGHQTRTRQAHVGKLGRARLSRTGYRTTATPSLAESSTCPLQVAGTSTSNRLPSFPRTIYQCDTGGSPGFVLLWMAEELF